MAERNVEALADLFHEEAVFVHMGGSMSRRQELDVIESGGIHDESRLKGCTGWKKRNQPHASA